MNSMKIDEYGETLQILGKHIFNYIILIWICICPYSFILFKVVYIFFQYTYIYIIYICTHLQNATSSISRHFGCHYCQAIGEPLSDIVDAATMVTESQCVGSTGGGCFLCLSVRPQGLILKMVPLNEEKLMCLKMVTFLFFFCLEGVLFLCLRHAQVAG